MHTHDTHGSRALDPITSALANALAPIVREAVADALAEHTAAEAPRTVLLDRAGLAAALGCSTRMIDRLRAEGMPGEVRIGDSPRWAIAELDTIIAWLRERGSR